MNSGHNKRPFVKVCGQTHTGSADAAASMGASMLGFIFHPRSPRSVSPERAAAVQTPCYVKRVGVFVKQGAEDISRIMEEARLDFAQLHGRQGTDVAKELGAQRVIRVLWPQQCESLEDLQEQIDVWEPHCAYYLLDAGKVGSGGTGNTMDVSEFDKLHFPHPWLLAGGLSPDNIQQLLELCHPNGIDLNSGLELAPGLKSPQAILEAVSALGKR